jgi:hypothetical protein
LSREILAPERLRSPAADSGIEIRNIKKQNGFLRERTRAKGDLVD